MKKLKYKNKKKFLRKSCGSIIKLHWFKRIWDLKRFKRISRLIFFRNFYLSFGLQKFSRKNLWNQLRNFFEQCLLRQNIDIHQSNTVYKFTTFTRTIIYFSIRIFILYSLIKHLVWPKDVDSLSLILLLWNDYFIYVCLFLIYVICYTFFYNWRYFVFHLTKYSKFKANLSKVERRGKYKDIRSKVRTELAKGLWYDTQFYDYVFEQPQMITWYDVFFRFVPNRSSMFRFWEWDDKCWEHEWDLDERVWVFTQRAIDETVMYCEKKEYFSDSTLEQNSKFLIKNVYYHESYYKHNAVFDVNAITYSRQAVIAWHMLSGKLLLDWQRKILLKHKLALPGGASKLEIHRLYSYPVYRHQNNSICILSCFAVCAVVEVKKKTFNFHVWSTKIVRIPIFALGPWFIDTLIKKPHYVQIDSNVYKQASYAGYGKDFGFITKKKLKRLKIKKNIINATNINYRKYKRI